MNNLERYASRLQIPNPIEAARRFLQDHDTRKVANRASQAMFDRLKEAAFSASASKNHVLSVSTEAELIFEGRHYSVVYHEKVNTDNHGVLLVELVAHDARIDPNADRRLRLYMLTSGQDKFAQGIEYNLPPFDPRPFMEELSQARIDTMGTAIRFAERESELGGLLTFNGEDITHLSRTARFHTPENRLKF